MRSEKIERIKAILPEKWQYAIEESKGLPIGIFAVKTDENKLFYVKIVPIRDEDEILIGFEYLSAKELAKYGLSVQESVGEELKDYVVEETVNEDLWNHETETIEEYKARMKAKVKSGNLSEEQFQKLVEKTSHVVINMPKGTELKSEETQKLKRFFEGARNKLIEKLREHGTEIPESQIQSMEDLQVFSGILRDYNERAGKGSSGKPTGTVPLASQSAGEDSGFDSHKQMISYLKEASKGRGLESQEARKILDALWREKMPQAVKNREIIAQFPSDEELSRGETTKSLINKEHRRKMKKRYEDDEN